MNGPETIASLEEFLAHALTLEREAWERYQELADVMVVHNNTRLADLFQRLAGFSEQHAGEVSQHAAGLTLPQIQPWEFKWIDAEGPETGGHDGTHYLMTPLEALRYALHNEIRGRDYYALVAGRSPNEAVRPLAAEFAAEETEHVRLLEDWIARTPATEPLDDLDPPHEPG